MLPKIDLFQVTLRAAAITWVFSQDEDRKGYAARTLSFYVLAPLVEVIRSELMRDLMYFLGTTEVTRLADVDDIHFNSVSLTGEEAFIDLINEVAPDFPFEQISLRGRIIQAIGVDEEEVSYLLLAPEGPL